MDDINSTLERLEKNLEDLDSARQQVEKTIKASTDLQKLVSSYILSVKELCISLKALDTELGSMGKALSEGAQTALLNLEKSCKQVIKDFDDKTKKAIEDFKGKTAEELGKFSGENTKLSESISTLHQLYKSFKESTDIVRSIGGSLHEILMGIRECNNSLTLLKNQINSFKNENIAKINGAKDETIKKIDASSHTLVNSVKLVESKSDTLLEKCELIKSNINKVNSVIDALKSEVLTLKKESSKSANINRWILIIGILLLAFLQYIFR